MSTYLLLTPTSPEPLLTPPNVGAEGVLVFRTALKSRGDVNRVAPLLDQIAGRGRWHVDLEDWEKVLRIETSHVQPCRVIQPWAGGLRLRRIT